MDISYSASLCSLCYLHYAKIHPSPLRCRNNIVGRQCDRCSPGFYGYPNCRPCDCNEAGTEMNVCDSFTGRCLCKVSFPLLLPLSYYIGLFSLRTIIHLLYIDVWSLSGKCGRPSLRPVQAGNVSSGPH